MMRKFLSPHHPLGAGRCPRALLWPLLGLALVGCSFTPRYERPVPEVPAQWPQLQGVEAASGLAAGLPGPSNASDQGAVASDLPWQQFFSAAPGGGSQELQQLIELGLENNQDLKLAAANIEQTRAQFQIQRAAQLPTLGFDLNQTRTAPNQYQVLGLGGSVSSSSMWTVGVSSWELDLFGRIRALKDVALAQFLSSTQARKSVQMSLIANIADTWLSLETDTQLLLLAQWTLGTREQTLKLTQLRFDKGAASALDLQEALSLQANARAAMVQQVRLRAQDINALALLTGVAAERLPIAPVPKGVWPQSPTDNTKLASSPPGTDPLPSFATISAGLPSALLLRRPDVQAAEQQLIAANANIGAARAAFFPRISLTAGFGRVSNSLDHLFGGGSSFRAWTFAPDLSIPIFDFGRNTGNLQAAKAQREGAVAQYQKTIQSAFREVADALAGRATYDKQLQYLLEQVRAERQRYQLSDLSYRNGAMSFLNLLDAQRALFATEQSVAQIRLAQRVNDVALYKALGGGWSAFDEQRAQTQMQDWARASESEQEGATSSTTSAAAASAKSRGQN